MTLNLARNKRQKGACDRGVCSWAYSVWLGRRRRRRAASGALERKANGEGASFGRGRPGYGALARWRIAYGLAAFVPIAIALDTAASELTEAEQKGLDIALEAREKKVGFENFTASQVMVLRNKQGRESRRALRVKVMEVEEDGDRSLFVFDEPRDVQGTAFLIHSHKDKADDQWLYLPALNRVKRISSANRSGSFMGSEFAYEDMSPPEVERFTYRYLRDEPCGELTCTVVERFPVDGKSGYSRQVAWQDTDELRLWKVEYFDRKNAHLKTLTIDGYERYLDRYWQASNMTMVNRLTGKSTVLTWTDYQFQTDLVAMEFTQTGLKRVR